MGKPEISRQLPTRSRRYSFAPARSVMGHEDQFPPPSLNGRYRRGETTFAGISARRKTRRQRSLLDQSLRRLVGYA
jgi:hypothetical protein